jgi:hypothetical protein
LDDLGDELRGLGELVDKLNVAERSETADGFAHLRG